jgi:hypothetical protein
MAKRLTEHHPLTKKLRALEEFMDKNKIFLTWDGYRMTFSDEEGETANVRDLDSGEVCTTIPWMCETKLTREE